MREIQPLFRSHGTESVINVEYVLQVREITKSKRGQTPKSHFKRGVPNDVMRKCLT